ncbi:MAG TPA: macro domain-containing protein [Candidatus Limnocylindria bacterium]
MAIPIEIDVWQGDIAELEVDAIVVPAHESLFMTSAVARAVKRRAGDGVERDAVRQGPMPAGSAVVTAGGSLAAPYVIHAIAVGHDLVADAGRLAAALDEAFSVATRLGLRRLAMPPLGAERGVFGVGEAIAQLLAVVERRAAAAQPLPASLVIAAGSPAEATAIRAALPVGFAG